MKEPNLNPVVSAAACLHKLRSPSEKPATQKELEKELGVQMVNVTMGHLKELEGMLVVQANVLQGIFTHAAERYAAAGNDDGKAKLYSAIALKAQNHSRQTVALVARIKKSSDYNRRPPMNIEKVRNELFRPAPVRQAFYPPPGFRSQEAFRDARTGRQAVGEAAPMETVPSPPTSLRHVDPERSEGETSHATDGDPSPSAQDDGIDSFNRQ